MKPLDRLLVLKVVALGASAYLVPLGIGVLLFVLIAALVATWRGSR